MILAEKIMTLRKKEGWSQEELAEKLSVSRQSVSKWELGAAIPDLDKIIRLAEAFGVSTDYLLKDNMETVAYADGTVEEKEEVRRVSLDEANEFLDVTSKVSKGIAIGTVFCVLCSVVLILLAGVSEFKGTLTENQAVAIGLSVLFAFIVAGVSIIIYNAMKLTKFEYLNKEVISLEYGVSGIVSKKKSEYDKTFRLSIITGIALCILSPVPLIISSLLAEDDFLAIVFTCVMLVIISVAVYIFVTSGMKYGSYTKLLQEEEFTVENKQRSRKGDAASGAYWCVATAVFLGWSFITKDWTMSWIVWPIAGVLYVPFKAVVNAIQNRNR